MENLTDQELKLLFHHIPSFANTFFREDSCVFRDHDGLNKTHVHAVMFLKMNGPCAMSVVARFLRLEKGSFTPIANRLIDWGYVIRELDPADHRKFLLRLTESGLDFATRLRAERSEHFINQIGKLSRTERRQLFAAISQIQQLLVKINGRSDDDHFRMDHRDKTSKEHSL